VTPAKRRRAGKSAEPAKTMADYAMPFERLGLWMSERANSTTLLHPQATSLSMLDGAIAAVVAGPVSMMPEEWVCPLLGVDPDDFNHDTETFSAIAATLMRHNAISSTLPTKPNSFKPLFLCSLRPSPKTRGATFQPSSMHCGSSGCQAGSPRARNFPQTCAEQGYPLTAYVQPLRPYTEFLTVPGWLVDGLRISKRASINIQICLLREKRHKHDFEI